jgi:hypothetical protein
MTKNLCYFCNSEATEKRRIYDPDLACSLEVNFCRSCACNLDEDKYKPILPLRNPNKERG